MQTKLVWAVILFVLFNGCIVQESIKDEPQILDTNALPTSDPNSIDGNKNRNNLLDNSIAINLKKTEYAIDEIVEFELYNGLNEPIWMVENLDSCMSGPFQIITADNLRIYSPIAGVSAVCAAENRSVQKIESKQSQIFSWNLSEYTSAIQEMATAFGIVPLTPGEYKIYMEYYTKLTEAQIGILNQNAEIINSLTEKELQEAEDAICQAAPPCKQNVISLAFNIVGKNDEAIK